MAEKNLYINRLLCDPVYFADLVNGVLFGGRQRLKPSELTPVADASGVMYVAVSYTHLAYIGKQPK